MWPCKLESMLEGNAEVLTISQHHVLLCSFSVEIGDKFLSHWPCIDGRRVLNIRTSQTYHDAEEIVETVIA